MISILLASPRRRYKFQGRFSVYHSLILYGLLAIPRPAHHSILGSCLSTRDAAVCWQDGGCCFDVVRQQDEGHYFDVVRQQDEGR